MAESRPFIYFNNAATTWPKPEQVYQAVDRTLRSAATPMRAASGGGGPTGPSDPMGEARREIASFLGVADPTHLVFTPGCTYSLNLAILGLPWHDQWRGAAVLMSGLEHHAVSRPIRRIARQYQLDLHIAPYSPERPIDLDFVEDRLRAAGGRIKLVACTMASNVSGDILPSAELVQLAHRYGALCLLDAAQSAGVLPVNIDELGCDLLSIAGHKGLFGPPGVGLLYAAPTVKLECLAEGGTGQDSGKHELGMRWPATYEIGTHNLPAIVGLEAGVKFVRSTGVDRIRAHERGLVTRLIDGLRQIPGITIHGPASPERRTSVVSMTFDKHTPQDVGAALAHDHGIVARFGYHCAPMAHQSLGTLPGPGTLRMSPGFFNTEEQVDQVLAAVKSALSH